VEWNPSAEKSRTRSNQAAASIDSASNHIPHLLVDFELDRAPQFSMALDSTWPLIAT
jgi:hypothetical protein